MIELPNPFDPTSGTDKPVAVGPAPPPRPAAAPFPRGFDPERFLADVEPLPTSETQAEQMNEDDIVRIVEALVRLAERGT